MVNLTLRLLSRPDVERLPTIFKQLGTEYDEKLLTERPHVSALVRDSLVRRARDFNIVLDDVAITHLSYGTEFSVAVEKKQVAQQEAERSKFLVAKAEQERRAAVIRAEGESEAAKLISEATRWGQGYWSLGGSRQQGRLQPLWLSRRMWLICPEVTICFLELTQVIRWDGEMVE
ncbi:uncharacterized protein A4U43_C08F28380 [Asparagus officinalis]|nr:uncharacterized protein A4U43_C08F28380 [Asparagus officinalis]